MLREKLAKFTLKVHCITKLTSFQIFHTKTGKLSCYYNSWTWDFINFQFKAKKLKSWYFCFFPGMVYKQVSRDSEHHRHVTEPVGRLHWEVLQVSAGWVSRHTDHIRVHVWDGRHIRRSAVREHVRRQNAQVAQWW